MIPSFEAIERVLQEKVAPQLEVHNGGIKLKSVNENGEVRVVFLGACSNCPSMGDTMENSVKEALEEAFPESTLEVIAVNEVSDELWNLAKSIIRNQK